MMNEVVLTGLGILSGFGIGKQVLWDNILTGNSAIQLTNDWDLPNIKSQYFAKVPAFSVKDYIPTLKPPFPSRYSQMGLVATALALQDAQLDLSELDPGRIGMILSTDFGPNETVERYLKELFTGGAEAVSPIQFSRTVANGALGDISRTFHLKGPSSLVIGENSLCYAYDILQEGLADVIICGGLDEVRDPIVWAYQELGLLAETTKQHKQILPAEAGFVPYSSNSSGSVLGEGAAMIVLETKDHVNRRKATYYARVLGHSTLCDRTSNYLLTERSTQDLVTTMISAMHNAEITSDDISFAIGCASSHPNISRAELSACENVWIDSALHLTNIKGAIGETFGSAALLSTGVGALSLASSMIPPCACLSQNSNISILSATPEFSHVNIVFNRPEITKNNLCLINSIHIGGNNCSVVLAS